MKKRNKILVGSFGVVAMCCVAGWMFGFQTCSAVQSQNENPPQSKFQVTLDTSIAPVIHLEYNFIQFYSRKALDNFYTAWNSTGEKKLSVVHLGDSHLQADYYPGQIRKNLQSLHGDGGRGTCFPYSAAATYSSNEYKSEHTGEWEWGKSLRLPPKVPLGVIGMAVRTSKAGNGFTLTFDNPVPNTYDRLRIYCKKQHNSFDLSVDFGDGNPVTVAIDSSSTDSLPYYEIKMPVMGNVLKATTVQANDFENEFEFYGFTMECSADKGAVVHNCGVGGAMYRSILYEALFPQQLPTLEPDVVIVDFGTNDYLYDDSIKPDLDTQIVQTIRIIREACPNASIILTSAQDMNWRKMNLEKGEDFSDLIHRIAREQDCGMFDWYWISGGRTAMSRFMDKGYANDWIHLSPKGYRLKGDLLTDAMLKTVKWMEENPTGDSIVCNTDSISEVQRKILLSDSTRNPALGKPFTHVVRSGETLGGIARKYGVTVSQIKKWNNLRSDRINVKQRLTIYRKK